MIFMSGLMVLANKSYYSHVEEHILIHERESNFIKYILPIKQK